MFKAAKMLLSTAFMIAVVSGSAFATVSRDTALSSKNWMVADDTNRLLTPTDILNYKGLVIGELGGGTGAGDDYAGVHISAGAGVLALYVGGIPSANRTLEEVSTGAGGTTNVPIANVSEVNRMAIFDPGPPPVFNPAAPPAGRFSVLYGVPVGNLNLAGGVDYFAETIFDFEGVDAAGDKLLGQLESSLLNVNLGASMVAGLLNPLSVGLSFGIPSFEGSSESIVGGVSSKSIYESDGGTDLAIHVKAKFDDFIGENVTSYLYVGFGSQSLDGKSTDSAGLVDEKELKGSGVTVGWANNHKIGDSSLVLMSIAFMNTSEENNVTPNVAAVTPVVTSDKTTMTSIPLTLGFESQVLDWLTVRLSSVSSLVTTTENETDLSGAATNKDTVKSDTSAQSFVLGTTFKLSDRLSIDGVLREEFVFDGPYFVGGVLDNGISSLVSLVMKI